MDRVVCGVKPSDGVIDNEERIVKDILFSSFREVGGEARIATLTVKSLKQGNTELNLLASDISPFSSQGEKLAVTYSGLFLNIIQ